MTGLARLSICIPAYPYSRYFSTSVVSAVQQEPPQSGCSSRTSHPRASVGGPRGATSCWLADMVCGDTSGARMPSAPGMRPRRPYWPPPARSVTIGQTGRLHAAANHAVE